MPNTFQQAQKRLLALWVCGSLPAMLIMLVQSLNDYYGSHDQEAWGWLFASVMPTLGVLVASYVAQQQHTLKTVESTDPTVFTLAVVFSTLYLIVVNLALLYLPFSVTSPVATLHRTNLLLGALQGLVGSCLGVFFVSSRGKADQKEAV
jgi:hypothetical protein